MPISIENMTERDIYSILREALYEFPVMEVKVDMPEWIARLAPDNWLKKIYIEKIRESVIKYFMILLEQMYQVGLIYLLYSKITMKLNKNMIKLKQP